MSSLQGEGLWPKPSWSHGPDGLGRMYGHRPVGQTILVRPALRHGRPPDPDRMYGPVAVRPVVPNC